ncbi:Nicalin-1 Nicastrin-like protein 1 [Triplophysa tibetana]|uniref:BOS complex subunit NCLN n=1 Tax=Triplophysa tibetana TaxID=1572043 RepID=A0A5A9PGQ3_9TELE|nr:Nicalin-1 Nicastrin-like protein 1 [Triplophysa tibetana]
MSGTSKVVALVLLSAHLLHASALPAASSYEFNVYRMQQYNLQQDKYGCRGAIVVAEARSAADNSLTRRCVIMKLPDFTEERYLEAKKQNAAAVLILLPKNISAVPPEIVQSFMAAESQVLQKETLMPVYVAPEDEQLLCMYEEVNHAAATKSASALVRVLRSIISTTAFQILVSSSPIKPITDTTIIALEGFLPGAGEDPPTIVITAHYDTFGLAPWLAYGADSNGSGVAMLLELVRLFQRIYSDPRSQPPYHLLFTLTGAGKYNFLGTKRWLEENMDRAESSLLHDNVAFVLCLDSLGNGDELFLHVSRPPKPGTSQFSFVLELEQVISGRFPWVSFGTIHKKINLQETTVAWEHERFGMKRIPGFTLSHIENSKSELRGSILDTMEQVDIMKLRRNVVIVAESLGRFIYNLTDKGSSKDTQVFKNSLDVQDSRLSALMSMMTSIPRAVQLLDREPEHVLLINSLEQEFRYYLKQVYRHTFHLDRSITYAEEFSNPARGKPTQPRPSSAYRRNNPHPRPDFLMPRQLQTGCGSQRHFQTTTPISFLPPVRHISVQFPDVQTGESMQSSQKDSKARASTAVYTLPPAGWLLKPQRTDVPHSSMINTQG